MAAKFEIKKAKNGQFFFNLKAANGQIILTSEMYKAKSGAKNGIASVQKNAANEDLYECKTTSGNKSFFVLKAKNKQVIGQSQMYASPSSAKKGVASVKNNSQDARIEDLT